MEDNWYETSVAAIAPHRIITVVDWASDSPIPTPAPSVEPATYNVFGWGINDPTEGNRSINKENYDALASPVGWHSIPFGNDPSLRGMTGRKDKEFFRNTTTTWGNNVSVLPSCSYQPLLIRIMSIFTRSLHTRTGKVEMHGLTTTALMLD